jgi:hypothetical protein
MQRWRGGKLLLAELTNTIRRQARSHEASQSVEGHQLAFLVILAT